MEASFHQKFYKSSQKIEIHRGIIQPSQHLYKYKYKYMKASLNQVLQEFTDWKTTSFLWIKQPAPSFSCNNYLSHSTLSFNYKRSDFIFMKIKILDLASSQLIPITCRCNPPAWISPQLPSSFRSSRLTVSQENLTDSTSAFIFTWKHLQENVSQVVKELFSRQYSFSALIWRGGPFLFVNKSIWLCWEARLVSLPLKAKTLRILSK